MEHVDIWLPYVMMVNILGFIFMAIDKRKAKQDKWRIPERTLWGIAILGGALGSYIGMKTFRHKTKHTSFVIGMPLLFVIHIVILFLI